MKREVSSLPDLSHIGNKYRKKTQNAKNAQISKTLKTAKRPTDKNPSNRNRQHYKTAIAKIFNDSGADYYLRSDLKLGVESMVQGFHTDVFSEALLEMLANGRLFKIKLDNRPAISRKPI